MLRRVLLLLLIAAGPVPSHATFGRWIVVCDNVLSCEARAVPDATAADLRVTRAAGDVAAVVTLTFAETPDPDALRVDTTALTAPWRIEHPGGATTLTLDRPDAVAALLARLRDGHALSWGAGDDAIPLDGMTAALLRVDAVQGRPGTRTPLIAPAGPGVAPPAPALPVAPRWSRVPAVSAADARRLVAATRAAAKPALLRAECDLGWTEEDEADALDRGHAVVLLSCIRAAYQTSSLVFIAPRSGPPPTRPVSLAIPSLGAEAGLVGVSFDGATGQLAMSSKGRGLADCGLSASWVWSAGAFRPVEASYQELCGGAAPGDWPALFRTAPAAR